HLKSSVCPSFPNGFAKILIRQGLRRRQYTEPTKPSVGCVIWHLLSPAQTQAIGDHMADNLSPMWIVHLWNLLVESVSTAPHLISGNWPAVFFTIGLAIIGGFLEWIKEGRPPMKDFFKR